ncbi:hypothetical protein ACCD10_29480 [Pseudomonas sp. Pseusp122]|uniref:hypothetical protein n=1 Tax=unclassified Pseudomonas TaxID=196821 RepID=UPI0039A77823
MIRFKNALLIFGLLFSFSAFTQGDGNVCGLDISQSRFDISGCTQTDGVTLRKLISSGQPVYEGNLARLPVFILVGDNLDVILKLINGGDSPYSKFMQLPSPYKILSAIDASSAVKTMLDTENWRLTNVIDFTYEGAGDNQGPYMICSTLDKKVDSGYVVVSQCNDIQEENIATLKDLLDLVEVQLR